MIISTDKETYCSDEVLKQRTVHTSAIHYNDLALILTWPDATIRGDEKWMMFFKKIGLVKNLNFKVGHTGIVIVKRETGEMHFYDFGRYITSRGYGRARSKLSDPRLEIKLTAKFEGQCIANLEEIVTQFEKQKAAMYGEGTLYFSVASDINFELAKAYGDACVHQGTFPYGAVAPNNNNCSRFICRMLMRSSRKYCWYHSINLPETIKASPISNVVNAVADRMVYSYTPEQGMQHFKMSRWQSFCFLLKKLGDNVRAEKAHLLPDDRIIGCMTHSSKPISIPEHAQYLGGVGDGAWFVVQAVDAKKVIVERYTSKGDLEYMILGEPTEEIDILASFEITYDSHLLFTHIRQGGRKIRINHTQCLMTCSI